MGYCEQPLCDENQFSGEDMKTIRLDLPYKTKPDGLKTMPDKRRITVEVLTTMVRLRYGQGMNGADVNIWGELTDLFDETLDNEEGKEVEVETSAFKWIYDVIRWCSDNSKVPPHVAPWVRIISEHFDEVKKESKLEVVK